MIFYIRNFEGKILAKARTPREAIEKLRRFREVEVQII